MSLLIDKVVPSVSSSKNSVEVWDPLTKSYANSSSSHIMGLIGHLVTMTHGTQSMFDYLGTIRSLANEFALIGSLVPNNHLTLHVLNGVDNEYKKLTTVV
ncbi:hypothetical protein LWI28_012810 [Acer negundo]|uniref:Uncharacterized protein n=1 Tax=Acer negundo TaxID=4023 RepID=A0AAD5P1L7_ACENE|nr:hypothetical protein LWI28_012810 [Acer negundo]